MGPDASTTKSRCKYKKEICINNKHNSISLFVQIILRHGISLKLKKKMISQRTKKDST